MYLILRFSFGLLLSIISTNHLISQNQFENNLYVIEDSLIKIIKKQHSLRDKDFTHLELIPVFSLDSIKTKNYNCYDDITKFISFETPSAVGVLIYNEHRIISTNEFDELEMFFYDLKNYNLQYMAYALPKSPESFFKEFNRNIFMIQGLSDFWTSEDNLTVRLKLNIGNNQRNRGKYKGHKMQKSSKYIAKEYGAVYIKSLVDERIYLGRLRPICD